MQPDFCHGLAAKLRLKPPRNCAADEARFAANSVFLARFAGLDIS